MDTWLGSIGYTSLKRMIPQYKIFHWFLMISSWNKASWWGSWARLHQSIRSRSSRRQVKHIDCGASGGVRPEPCGERLCRWCQGGKGKMNRLFLGKWSGKWGSSFTIFIFDGFKWICTLSLQPILGEKTTSCLGHNYVSMSNLHSDKSYLANPQMMIALHCFMMFDGSPLYYPLC